MYPPSRKVKNSSRAWKYGGFLKDKFGTLATKNTICGLCGKSHVYKNSPSNLMRHLEEAHAEEMNEIEKNVKDNKPNSLIQSNLMNGWLSNSQAKKYKATNPKQSKFNKAITKWLVKNCRPLKVVSDESLQVAVEILDPRIKLPSEYYVGKEIDDLHKIHFDKTVADLESVSSLSCTNDAGTSVGSKSFIDVNVHWITEDFRIKAKILDVIRVKGSKSAEFYYEKCRESLDKFGVNPVAYNTDNEPTMLKAFRMEVRNGCIAHIISKSTFKALEKCEFISEKRSKYCMIATRFNKSPLYKTKLAHIQQERSVKIISLK